MGNYYFVIRELETIKRSNELAIIELEKLRNEDGSRYTQGHQDGYINALKYQIESLKSTIELYKSQNVREVV